MHRCEERTLHSSALRHDGRRPTSACMKVGKRDSLAVGALLTESLGEIVGPVDSGMVSTSLVHFPIAIDPTIACLQSPV